MVHFGILIWKRGKLSIVRKLDILNRFGKEKVDYIDLKKENLGESIKGMIIPLKDKIYVLPRTEDSIFCIEVESKII